MYTAKLISTVVIFSKSTYILLSLLVLTILFIFTPCMIRIGEWKRVNSIRPIINFLIRCPTHRWLIPCVIFKAAAYCFRGARCLTPQFANDNSLTGLQDRQRAPQQQLSRCLKNGTRIELSLSEISDEEVDYGSYASNVDLDIASDSSWSAL